MEQVSSVAQREQLEATLDYVREGDTFTSSPDSKARRSRSGCWPCLSGSRWIPARRLADAGCDRRRGAGRAGSHAGEAGGGRRQGPRRGGAAKALCRPLGGRAGEIIRLKEAGIRPSEIAGSLGIGRASVYRVLANHAGENSHAMVVTPPAQRQPSQFIRSDLAGETLHPRVTV
jgi:hypothetical protein